MPRVTSEELLGFLRDELGVDTSDVDEHTPLFSSGVVDSFSLVSVLTFIETQTGVRVGAMDVTLDNFDSVKRILAFIERAETE